MNSILTLKKIIFGVSFLFFLNASGQTRSLKGVVSGSKKETLAYVTVMAKPVNKKKSMKFAMTDDLGRYILDLEMNLSYEISFTTMGYQTTHFTHLVETNFRKDIQLLENVNQLEPVVIELPIVVKKDTLIYKVHKFVTGEERKLKDVLAKLPGIEVDAQGNVTSNGKQITHLLVEDKNFFGGNSKLAVENIPADAVSRVEVIDDYNEVTFLKGMHKSDKMAMNIKLKEGKKNFLFGNIETGVGNKKRHQSQANLFYYRPDFSINFIGGINNSGKKTLTHKDYESFIGSPSSVFDTRDFDNEKASITDFVEATDVIESKQKVGAFNFTKNFKKKLDISNYFIISSSTSSDLKERVNQYLVPDLNYTENVTNAGDAEKLFGIGKLKIDFKPSNKEEYIVTVLGKKSIQTSSRKLRSIIDENTRLVDNISDATNYYANGNLEWHKKIAKKHAFSFSTIGTYSNDDSDDFWQTNATFLSDVLPLKLSDIYKLKLLRNKKNKNITMLFKYYWTISNDNFLHFTMGNMYSEKQFFTRDIQVLNDDSENVFKNSGFDNDVNFELNDLYVGIHSDIRLGKFEFSQSIFAHNYKWSIDQFKSVTENKWFFLPDFIIRADFKSLGDFKFNYRLTNSFSDVSKLANRYYLKSYNSVYKGNEKLKNDLLNSFTLTYSKSNLFKRLYLLATVNFNKKLNGVLSSVVADNRNNYLTSIMANDISTGWIGNLLVRKMYRNVIVAVRSNFSNRVSIQSINDKLIENKNENGGYNLTIESRYDKLPIIKLGLKKSFGNNTSIAGNYNYKIDNPFVTVDYDFFKNYIFSFKYTYYKYQNKSFHTTNKYDLASMKLIFDSEGKHWGASLSVDNLFDAKFKNQNNYTTYITSDIKTYILPRIAMLTLTYKL